MRGWIVPALLTLALATPALAEQKGQPPQAAPPSAPQAAPQKAPQKGPMAKGSAIARITFAEPALALGEDESFSDAMQRVGPEVKRNCGKIESYGWEFREADTAAKQQHANAVFDSTMGALEKAGYKLSERKVRSIPDPETLVFTADRKENRLVLVWSPVKDATILLICDAKPL